jgi:hypothetical protein
VSRHEEPAAPIARWISGRYSRRVAGRDGGCVAALAGRRIDAPDAAVARFPLARRERVRSQLLATLCDRRVRALVTAAACGVDLLGLEAAGEIGAGRHVVLPFDRARFRRTSVVDRPGDWGPLYDAILRDVEDAGSLTELSYDRDDDEAFVAANHAMLDRAAEVAASLSLPLIAVVAWDGTPRDTGDVTLAFRDEARRRGLEVVELSTR